MNRLLEQLFEILEQEDRYKQTDQLITEEIHKALEPYKETLLQEEYEYLRGILFGISNMAMKQSFRIGFKSAVALLLDCTKMD